MNSQTQKSGKKLKISSSQSLLSVNNKDNFELPKIFPLTNNHNVYPLIPGNNKNNSLLNYEYHIEHIPIIVPNYKNSNTKTHRKNSSNMEFSKNDENSTVTKFINLKKNHLDKYLIENELYKDNSNNIILRKIYTSKKLFENQSTKNSKKKLKIKKNKSNKIIFSIFNSDNYPKNNYDYEIFDFKTENKNNDLNKKDNGVDIENKNINEDNDIIDQLKELNNKLNQRLDKIEEEEKNNQKDIIYLLQKNNSSKNSKASKFSNKKMIKKDKKEENKKVKVKPLGLYHRLAGGYNAQSFNVNRNMIMKNKEDN